METPRITSSHSADESEGGLFGVRTHSLIWVVPVLAVALGVFFLLMRRMGALEAATLALLPVLVVIGGLRLLQQAGPGGFLRDGCEHVLTGGDASPRPNGVRSQSPLFSPFPEGYLSDGLMVFGGLSGYVARGFWIETPDLLNASFSERNRAEETWSAILRLLPEEWSAQFRAFDDDSRLVPHLLEYAEHTTACSNVISRRLRNANFVHLSSMLEQGQLRQKRLTLFVGYRILNAGQEQSKLLSGANWAIQQWEANMRQLLGQIGGRVTAMSDQDVVRQWVDCFNPSLRGQYDRDSAANFDPSASLLEHVWNSELRGQGTQGFVLDGYHHLCLSLRRLPSETYITLLSGLTSLPFGGVTVSVHLKRLPKEPILRAAQAKVERIHNQRREKPDQALAASQAQLEAKIQRLTAEGVVPLELELIVTVRAKSSAELLERVASVKAAIQRMNGAQAFEATLATSSRSLFAKSLPGWMWSSHRGFVLYVEPPTAVALLPLATTFCGYPGPIECLFPGGDGGLVNVVTSIGDGVSATPQNMVALGATGTGKSSAVTKMLIETAGDIGLTAIVETGLSQVAFTRALGSVPLEFKPGGMLTLNPLDSNGLPRSAFFISTAAALMTRMMGIPRDEDKARRQHALVSRELMRITTDQAEDWLRRWSVERREAVLRESAVLSERIRQNPQPLPDAFLEFREFQRAEPAKAAAELAAITAAKLRDHEHTRRSQVHDVVYAHLSPEEHLTLSSLREALELSDDEECRWLAVLLAPWSQDGPYGRLFDGPSNVAMDSPVLHYELGSIPESAKELESIVVFAALNSLRSRCLQLPTSVRKRVVIDEVSRFLDVPGGEAFLRELFESFRKHNTQVIIIGQQYSRIADSSIRAAIAGNARAWLIFNTGDAQDIARLCSDLGLSPMAQETIRRLPRPDQLTGPKYSEFLYFHTDARQPSCGTARYFLLPHDGVES